MKNAIFSILLQTLEEFKEESPVFLSCPISRHFFPLSSYKGKEDTLTDVYHQEKCFGTNTIYVQFPLGIVSKFRF